MEFAPFTDEKLCIHSWKPCPRHWKPCARPWKPCVRPIKGKNIVHRLPLENILKFLFSQHYRGSGCQKQFRMWEIHIICLQTPRYHMSIE